MTSSRLFLPVALLVIGLCSLVMGFLCYIGGGPIWCALASLAGTFLAALGFVLLDTRTGGRYVNDTPQ